MIYLLEDDDTIRNFVIYALNNSGLTAEGFDKPSAFWVAMKNRIPSLLLLDRMLPEEDGMEVLKKLRDRQDTKSMPIIMLTAMGTEYDKVMGLDNGADDYITKPFGTMELISRVKAMLRRAGSVETTKEYVIKGLYLNIEKHIVRANDTDINLTYKEFELLSLLMSVPGSVFTRDQILKQVWGYEFDGENRTVDVHVRSLRTKLLDCGDLIETVRGIGYKMGGNAS